MKDDLKPVILWALWLAAACLMSVMIGAKTAIARASSDIWEAAAMSPIQVNDWMRPERGWLYILDVQPYAGSPNGRIWLLDPAAAKLMGNISTGADPDFALSPDGRKLYVASKGKDRFSNLAIVDTAAGTILKTVTLQNRVVADGVPTFFAMSVLDDGLALRVLVNDTDSPDGDFLLDAIDTRTGELLPDPINLGKCGFGRFIDHPTKNQFDHLCPINNRIRQVNIDPKTREPDHQIVEFPWLRRLGIADAFLAAGGENISIIRGDGAVYDMGVDSAEFSPTRMKADIPGMVLPAHWPISPGGNRIYVGYNLYPDKSFYLRFERSAVSPRAVQAYELRSIDTHTWRTLGHTTGKGAPYWTAAVSPDGKTLYALSPQNHAVVVFGTEALHEIRIIPVGGTPALTLVAP
jgi:hypothetical protein